VASAEACPSSLATDARLTVADSDELFVGAESIVRSLVGDIEAGARLRLLRVIAGAELTVVEGAFQNASDVPGALPAAHDAGVPAPGRRDRCCGGGAALGVPVTQGPAATAATVS
jgi:hypothetical protein